MEHLKHLNEAQKQAVLTTQGPLLVLAGAGAGKTRVIAHRILEIIRTGVDPRHILAITFTNKAAGEMRERVLGLLSQRDGVPFISTFHSLGLTMIKEHRELVGLSRSPVLYDRSDSLRTMKEALKEVGADGFEPRAALASVSRQKGDGIDAQSFAVGARDTREQLIARVWLAYEKRLHDEGALDFDDLLLRAVQLLRTSAQVRAAYQKRFTHIHIDEYQDTNRVQGELVELLVGPERHICAVGDVDQTIYSWRGAQIENILSFEKKFPGSRVVMLEENYRSTKNILAAAQDIIVKNQYRPEKNLFTKNQEGARLSLYQAFDELDEASFVARKIAEGISEGAKPRDFAVLYRANFQSRAIEEVLLAQEVPYQVLGVRFFERKEVKDAISFVRAALYNTPQDLARIINVPPRGVGKVTLFKILSGKERELAGKMREKVASLRNLLAAIQESAARQRPAELIQFVIQKSGMERMLKEDKLEGQERLLNLRELVSLASRHETIEGFLESVALQSEQDELKEEKNAVRLMTVHAAKGLEFPSVFIVGLEEGLFPYDLPAGRQGGGGSAADKEEERRLMYVALTRAKYRVYLSYASYRTLFGSKNPTLPSQFLTDISQELLELESPDLPAGRRGGLGRTIYLE